MVGRIPSFRQGVRNGWFTSQGPQLPRALVAGVRVGGGGRKEGFKLGLWMKFLNLFY